MIVTKKYAKALIKSGRATVATPLRSDSSGDVYVAITRHDVQRTDHYKDC